MSVDRRASLATGYTPVWAFELASEFVQVRGPGGRKADPGRDQATTAVMYLDDRTVRIPCYYTFVPRPGLGLLANVTKSLAPAQFE